MSCRRHDYPWSNGKTPAFIRGGTDAPGLQKPEMSVRFGPVPLIVFRRTLAAARAKDAIGQVNHFLLTSMIGLQELRDADPDDLEDLPGQWNPKNQDASITRSQRFVRSATLVWVVDALDALCTAMGSDHPEVFEDETRTILGRRSVAAKVSALAPLHDRVGPRVHSDLVKVAVLWRNGLVHYTGSERLPQDVRGRIQRMLAADREKFRDLDPIDLLARYTAAEAPRLKEVASIVQAATSWIMDLDRAVVSLVDPEAHAKRLFKEYLTKPPKRGKFLVADKPKRRRILETFLRTNGFASADPDELSTQLGDSFWQQLTDLDDAGVESWGAAS